MQVSVETVGTLGRKLKIAVPAEDVTKEFNQRLKKLSKQVKMPGFRPGKVPLKMVQAQYGERLIDEVTGDLIESSLRQAIVQKGLRPVASPRVERKVAALDKDLEYVAEFDVVPEIKRLDIDGIAIERPVATVAAEDIDRTIETIRKQRTSWKPVERAAKLGDRVKMDFGGRMDGAPLEGGSANGFFAILGGGTLIEDLEKGIVGFKPGDSRTISATFPADYRHPPLAGKTVEFDVTLHEVSEPVLPELNAEFAKQLGIEDGNIDELREEIKANLEREAERRTQRVLRARALKALVDGNTFEIPQSLIDAEVNNLRRIDRSMGVQSDDATLQKRARERVAVGLALGEVIRVRNVKSEPSRIRAKLEEMASEYDSPAEFIRWHYEQPQRMAQIESFVIEDRAVEELLAQAKLEDKTVSFQDLLQLDTQTN